MKTKTPCAVRDFYTTVKSLSLFPFGEIIRVSWRSRGHQLYNEVVTSLWNVTSRAERHLLQVLWAVRARRSSNLRPPPVSPQFHSSPLSGVRVERLAASDEPEQSERKNSADSGLNVHAEYETGNLQEVKCLIRGQLKSSSFSIAIRQPSASQNIAGAADLVPSPGSVRPVCAHAVQ